MSMEVDNPMAAASVSPDPTVGDGAETANGADNATDATVDAPPEDKDEAVPGEGATSSFPDSRVSKADLMRPHVGSHVQVVPEDDGNAPNGCMELGEVGEVIEDDRSAIPFKVRAPNGNSSWYRQNQLEHLATYTVEDVLDQQRHLDLYSGMAFGAAGDGGEVGTGDGADALTDGDYSPFDVTALRFSWQPGRARETLNLRTVPQRAVHAAHTLRHGRCCSWYDVPRHRAIAQCTCYVGGLLLLVAAFTTLHALGYRELKFLLERDHYQIALDNGRNDGCFATQELLGVVRPSQEQWVGWPSWNPVGPTPPPSQGDGKPGVADGSECVNPRQAACDGQWVDGQFTDPPGSASHRVCVEEPIIDVGGLHQPTSASSANRLICHCAINWEGMLCDVPIPPSAPNYVTPSTSNPGCRGWCPCPGAEDSASQQNPCLNGGTCTERGGGANESVALSNAHYSCSCSSGYAGPRCEIPIAAPTPVPEPPPIDMWPPIVLPPEPVPEPTAQQQPACIDSCGRGLARNGVCDEVERGLLCERHQGGCGCKLGTDGSDCSYLSPCNAEPPFTPTPPPPPPPPPPTSPTSDCVSSGECYRVSGATNSYMGGFGAGADLNGIYVRTMQICGGKTMWRQQQQTHGAGGGDPAAVLYWWSAHSAWYIGPDLRLSSDGDELASCGDNGLPILGSFDGDCPLSPAGKGCVGKWEEMDGNSATWRANPTLVVEPYRTPSPPPSPPAVVDPDSCEARGTC